MRSVLLKTVQGRAESGAAPEPMLLTPGPFLGPGNRGSDQWERLQFESFLAGGIGLVNKYPALGDSVLTEAKLFI